jgi:hypothetical protein
MSHEFAIVAAAAMSGIQFIAVTLPVLVVWICGGAVTPPNDPSSASAPAARPERNEKEQ